MEEHFDPTTVLVHTCTALLAYSYIKEDFSFPFIFVLSPSILLICVQIYEFCKNKSGLKRAKYILTALLLLLFVLTFSQAVKNEGGMTGGFDDHKWIVRHRRSFQILIICAFLYSMLTYIDPQRTTQKSLFHQIMLNILSSLSTPLTVCSGGACNSIYISTITSILSSLSIPLTIAVPLLNVIGYVLQFVGAFSLYSVNKWRSYAFWVYIFGMLSQFIFPAWVGAILMIGAVVMNTRQNKFTYGKTQIFKESMI